MSFGLAKGRELDDAPGVIGVVQERGEQGGEAELPRLPDDILSRPEAGHVDIRKWFAHPERPLEIEIGCGKGGFLVQEAAAHPDVNYLGIEYAHEFYLYTADRVRRRQLKNVRMLCADASDFLTWRVPSNLCRVIHLYYSDPWPKRRHHKNRVIQDRFLAHAHRVLMPGGELRVVTDHDELWAWDMEHFARWTGEGPAAGGQGVETGLAASFDLLPFVPPVWAEEGEVVGTNYEKKFTHERKPPHACVLRSRSSM